MEKAISTFLVICMSFLLCAAANSNACTCGCDCGEKCACEKAKTVTGKEEIVVQTEKGPVIIPNSDGGSFFNEPFLEIIDARLKEVSYSKDGRVFLDLKFKCLYPEETHTHYPDPFDIYLTWLDEDGAIVNSDYHRLQNLNYEDVGWTCAYHNVAHDDEINLDEVKTVKITSFKAFLPEQNAWDEYHLSEPIVITLADLKIVK